MNPAQRPALPSLRSRSRPDRPLQLALICLPLLICLSLARSPQAGAAVSASPYELASASYLGDGGGGDEVRGSRIQSNGVIVLAANIGGAQPGGLSPILLNGAPPGASGALLRLSPDGRTVLSVTRLAGRVTDLSIDGEDHILVALWDGGLARLSPEADTLLWVRTPGRAVRIDAGEDGRAAVLLTPAGDPDDSSPGTGRVVLYDAAGGLLADFDGRHNTLDLCYDAASQTVVHVGWRQASVGGTPVQIAYLQGHAPDGTVRWLAYDWSTDPASARFINRPANNMADTRGYRCDVGADGKLYAAYEAAGGNHIFRYDPFDIAQPAAIVGGDGWHEFFNSKSEHKTFFARYEPATGQLLLAQQFTNRLTSGAANTVRVRTGNITADAAGRLYIGGESAWGLPLPGHPQFAPQPGRHAFLPPATGDYLGGGWFMVMDAGFEERLYVTRLTAGGSTRALDGRILEGDEANIVFGGHTTRLGETYTLNPLQPAPGGGSRDGWLAAVAPVDEILGSVRARIGADPAVGMAPLLVELDGRGSTSTNGGGTLTSFEWDFGDGQGGVGAQVTHTFAQPGVYTVTLTVRDEENESDTAAAQIFAAADQLFLPLLTGEGGYQFAPAGLWGKSLAATSS